MFEPRLGREYLTCNTNSIFIEEATPRWAVALLDMRCCGLFITFTLLENPTHQCIMYIWVEFASSVKAVRPQHLISSSATAHRDVASSVICRFTDHSKINVNHDNGKLIIFSIYKQIHKQCWNILIFLVFFVYYISKNQLGRTLKNANFPFISYFKGFPSV